MVTSDQMDPLLQLFDDVRAKYSELLTDFEADEAMIKGEGFDNIIPDDWQDDGLEPVKFTTINDAIENASDHILSFPRITVPERKVAEGVEQEREIAEKKRQFLDAWWDRVFVDQGDPLGQAKKSLVKGKMVLKMEVDWNLLPALPEKFSTQEKARFRKALDQVGRSRFIWKLRLLPKETVFEDIDSPHDPAFVFESFRITAAEAIRRFPSLKAQLGDIAPMERVEYKEYWSKPEGADRGQYVQWIEDERVHAAFNPYSWETPNSTADEPDWDGYVPYCIADPGWGDVDAESDPYDRYVSLTRPMRSLAESEVRQATSVEAALRLFIWKPLVTRGLPEVEEGERTLETGPGAVWDLSEEQSVEPLQWGETPVSVFQYLSKVQQETDRHSKFGALGGSPQRGVDTATEADAQMRNAATKLSGPVRSLRRVIMKISQWVLMDIEKVLEVPVTIYGATDGGPAEIRLLPREIKGFWFVNVQLETSDEASLNLRNARTWSDLYQRLPVSARTTLANAGVNNPQAEMDERQLEDLERSEPAMNLMLSMLLAAFQNSPEGQAVIAAFQQQMMNPGGGGGQPPPGEGGPAPNSIEQLRTRSRQDANNAAPERASF